MTAGAYGYSQYTANRINNHSSSYDRIPAPVASYLGKAAAATAGLIAMGEIYDSAVVEYANDGYSPAAIATAIDKGIDYVNSQLVLAEKFGKLGVKAGAAFVRAKKFVGQYVYVNEDGSTILKSGGSKKHLLNNSDIPDAKRPRGIGVEQTFALQEQVEMPIKMKLGTALKSSLMQSKSIENMLKKASGASSALFQFSGYMKSAQGKRCTTFMCFRHNIGKDGVSTTSPATKYETLSNMNILSPVAGSGIDLPGGSDNGNSNQPYHFHKDLSTWFHPMGRSKFEDTAWNMNRLKFMTPMGRSELTEPGGNWSAGAQEPLRLQEDIHFEPGKYRRTSAIYDNNMYETVNNSPTSVRQINDYNMVFNNGRVNYDFCNKGDGPVYATLIVYKVKRQNTTLSNHISTWENTPNEQDGAKGIPFALLPPLADGVKETYLSKGVGAGTLNGNSTPYDDWNTHPGKPLYPITSRVKQSKLPFREERRISFCLNSGCRRSVSLMLGGAVYDPVNTVNKNVLNAAGPFPVLDGHSFIVCLSVHGAKMTRTFDTTERLGDIYSEGRIEWNARYEESIGAAMFKDGNTMTRMDGRTYNFPGSGTGDDTLSGKPETPAMVMPITGAVRTTEAGVARKLTS